MNMERGFIDSIRNDPDNDGPRLIFADWLEEQDRADQANFIRAQCELALLRPLVVLETGRVLMRDKNNPYESLDVEHYNAPVWHDSHCVESIRGLLYMGYSEMKKGDVVDWEVMQVGHRNRSSSYSRGVGYIKSVSLDVTYRSKGVRRIEIIPMLETEGQHERREELRKKESFLRPILYASVFACFFKDGVCQVRCDPVRGFVDVVHVAEKVWRDLGPNIVKHHSIRQVFFVNSYPAGPFGDGNHFCYYTANFGVPTKRYKSEKEAIEDMSKMAIEWAIKESYKE